MLKISSIPVFSIFSVFNQYFIIYAHYTYIAASSTDLFNIRLSHLIGLQTSAQ